jgi:hypothetical protein
VCPYATSYCKRFCYMRKFECWQKPADRAAYERRLRQEWEELTPEHFGELLRRRKYPTDRIRFAAAGEALATPADVTRVESIIRTFPTILFWVPTRAWRSPDLRDRIRRRLLTLRNARVMASLDPSNTAEEVEGLTSDGWSTMFFGIDRLDVGSPFVGRYPCPKTWDHRHGFCQECSNGCFREGQVHVHLKKH